MPTNPDSHHPDNRSIDRRITDLLDELTDSEQRLAQVVRQTQGALSSFTARELANRAGVSNATAVRFFQRLGYATYAEARRQSREERAWASPAAEMGGTAVRSGGDGDFAAHVAHECRNLVRTAQAMPDGALGEATRILVGAGTIHVVGFRNSMVLASYARALLANVKPNVTLLPVAGMTLAEELAGFGKAQVLLAIGFRRRVPVLREIMAVAKQAGVPRVLIADDSASVTADLATVTLRCQNLGHGMFDSYVAAMSVLNYLANAVGLALGKDATDRLGRIEELHARLGSFGPEQAGRRHRNAHKTNRT